MSTPLPDLAEAERNVIRAAQAFADYFRPGYPAGDNESLLGRLITATGDLAAARSTPGAPTPPAEPSGTAALLARCDALDRLPAPEGGSGRSVPVDEIRRLLRVQSTPGPQVLNCDQSPHPPAQCPRCEPIAGAS